MILRAAALAAILAPLSAGVPAGTEEFPPANACAPCHSRAPTSAALTSPSGEDVSQHWLWQGSMMAQAFLDPYWRAAVEQGEASAGAGLESTCLPCHAPGAAHETALRGAPPPTIAALAIDPTAVEGVSCSFCHRISGRTIARGVPESGGIEIGEPGVYRGPIESPGVPSVDAPGISHGYEALFDDSAYCAPCHTLRTESIPGAHPFLEQSPYLEWQNSVYSSEVFPTAESRTCQQCHMPLGSPTRVARAPDGTDEPIPVRAHFEMHAFLGGNAFLLEMMADHAAELGVVSDPAALRDVAARTRAFLAERTARLSATPPEREGGRLRFDVIVENLAGHKFPSAYPSRRAWLEVVVRADGETVFAAGSPDARGRLLPPGAAPRPHIGRIDSSDDLLVYELVPGDESGAPTTDVPRMATRLKDNRLLPRGWQPTGPDAAETAPVGTAGDPDFAAGSDRVEVNVPDPESESIEIEVRLLYQTIPPEWVDPLRALGGPAARRFVRLHDSRERSVETIAELRIPGV